MTEKVFVDTNVLIYAHDLDAGVKRHRAANALAGLWESGSGCLSTQVLQEFFVNATMKFKTRLDRSNAREIVRTYAVWVLAPIRPETVLRATEIAETWQISFWDGMIVASAEEVGASSLLTEDLSEGQVIAGVKITNPIR